MRIEIFSRPGCHLCDEAKELLHSANTRFDFELVEKNVEENPQWEAEYGSEVPVVLIDGRKAFKFRVRQAELVRRLSRRVWRVRWLPKP